MTTISRNSVVLFLLALLFLAPGLTALYFYQHPQWLSGKATNKGQFFEPPLLISSLTKSSSKWHLVLWSPGDCGDACSQPVDQLARIRLALGRHYYEVDQTLLMGVPGNPLSHHLMKILHRHGVELVHLPDIEEKALLTYSPDMRIFIANPEGFLVLSYAVSAQPDDIYHDLKQLLTTTQTKSN